MIPGFPDLTHIDKTGKAKMVNVGQKIETSRTAVAVGKIMLGSKTFCLVESNQIKKGDVLSVAQIAGIMGAKQTSALIPLCHPLLLDSVDVKVRLDKDLEAVVVEGTVSCTGRTGVEMEALTAVTVALLTLYDMCKAVDKDMVMGDIKLIKKTGGKSDYRLCN